MFVYSAISCDEILVFPIFRACVSTRRYRDRRAATPTFKRSATRPPSLDFVTAFSVVPAALAVRLCNRPAQRVGMHVVDETAPPVDLYHRDPLAVRGLQLGVAVDRDLPQLEAELVARSGHDAPGRRAEMAAGRGEEDDLRHRRGRRNSGCAGGAALDAAIRRPRSRREQPLSTLPASLSPDVHRTAPTSTVPSAPPTGRCLA